MRKCPETARGTQLVAARCSGAGRGRGTKRVTQWVTRWHRGRVRGDWRTAGGQAPCPTCSDAKHDVIWTIVRRQGQGSVRCGSAEYFLPASFESSSDSFLIQDRSIGVNDPVANAVRTNLSAGNGRNESRSAQPHRHTFPMSMFASEGTGTLLRTRTERRPASRCVEPYPLAPFILLSVAPPTQEKHRSRVCVELARLAGLLGLVALIWAWHDEMITSDAWGTHLRNPRGVLGLCRGRSHRQRLQSGDEIRRHEQSRPVRSGHLASDKRPRR